MNKHKNVRLLTGGAVIAMAAALLAACASPAPAGVNSPAAAPAYANAAGQPAAVQAPANGNTASGAGSAAGVSFSKDIMPIFQNSCINCHGGEKTSKGLDMKTFDSLMAGSQNGAVITAGDAASSKLIQSIQSGKMPKRGDKLTSDQIQLLIDWVNAGAKNN